MKTVIIYDSQYGNTEKIAQSIARSIPNATIAHVSKAHVSDLIKTELLIVGSPVHGGQASEAMRTFLRTIPVNGLKGVRAATFDTRLDSKTQGFALKLLMKLIRYADEKIAASLQTKGATLVSTKGFIVLTKSGPLKDDEVARAKTWAMELTK